jgi:hypothetical protein
MIFLLQYIKVKIYKNSFLLFTIKIKYELGFL